MTRRSIGERPKQPNASGMLGQMGGIDIYIYIYIYIQNMAVLIFIRLRGEERAAHNPLGLQSYRSIYLYPPICLWIGVCLCICISYMYRIYACVYVCLFV